MLFVMKLFWQSLQCFFAGLVGVFLDPLQPPLKPAVPDADDEPDVIPFRGRGFLQK